MKLKLTFIGLCLAAVFASCEKQNETQVSTVSKDAIKMTTYPGDRRYLYQQSDGSYYIGFSETDYISFTNIVYKTGSYQTGDAVVGFDAAAPNGIVISSGGVFTARFLKYPDGTAARGELARQLNKYEQDYQDFISGAKDANGTLKKPNYPVFQDYVKAGGAADPYSYLITGAIVRDVNSPSTFSYVSSEYPVRPIVSNPGDVCYLGELNKNGYLIELWSDNFKDGNLIGVKVRNATTLQEIGATVGGVKSVPENNGIHYVRGVVRLTDGTEIHLDDYVFV